MDSGQEKALLPKGDLIYVTSAVPGVDFDDANEVSSRNASLRRETFRAVP